MSRANPFGDLDDFAPQPAAKPVPEAAIDEIAESSGFPSRKAASKPVSRKSATSITEPATPRPPRRRRMTGRNRQINIKATEETITELYRIADEMDLPLGAVLEQALAALAKAKD